MVRQSQPTIVLCLLLWPSGSSVTANDRSVSVIMVKWFVSHSQQLFCVSYYGQMVRQSQPTIVLCLLLWPNGSSLTANDRICTNGSSVTANDRSVSAIMAKWFVTHGQRSFCVYYYGQMVRHSQPTIVLCLLLWPNGSSLTANNRSVYYYGQMVRHSQPTTILCLLLWPNAFVTHSHFIAKCQYTDCTRNVLWCQVHSSHIHPNHKTFNY